ncbi:MAG: DUF692 domain-containing protein [Kofleriaceae bacterium]|jgi:uncharacterized protein (UPF0276 family)|nr:DUF692 domain-containing protein [Kofleriaceae bacterium]
MLPDLAQRAPGAPAPRPAQRLRADALGIGLRPRHVRELIEAPERVGYLEIISENFLGPAPGPRRNLARLRGRVPIVLHGVTLGLLDAAPLDDDYLDAVCRLADEVDAPFVTDHLCWTGHAGARHHDLLPTPHRADLVEFAAERAAQVQRRLGRPFGIENLSSYVAFAESDLTEWEFYAQVVRSSGCWFMFDLNNVHVSAQNHGFDPHAYVDAIDFDRVLQVHLAGHTVEPDGLVVDTHDHPVADAVWDLYAYAWRRGGPFPTLIEWDASIPPLEAVLAEVARAASVRATAIGLEVPQ